MTHATGQCILVTMRRGAAFCGESSECKCGFSEKYDLLSSLVPVRHVLDRYALGNVAELVALFGTQNDSGSAWQQYRDSVAHMAFSCHSPAGTLASTSSSMRPRVSPATNCEDTACTLR